MIKKLTKHGNSQALVLDRAVLDLLKISSDTELEITTDGKRLLIEPIRRNIAELSVDNQIDFGARV